MKKYMLTLSSIIIALTTNLCSLNAFAEKTSYIPNSVVCISCENELSNAALEMLQQQEVTVSEIVYNTENSNFGLQPYEINTFSADKSQVTIVESGLSEFVDVYGIEADSDEKVYLSEYAEWSSDNLNVVFADRGRLLAIGSGDAEVSVKYGQFELIIYVTVQSDVDYESIIARNNMARDMTSEQRLRYVGNANSMVNCSWTPSANLTGWRSGYVFYAGQSYRGIPYSQTVNQVNKEGFLNSLGNSNFYSTYYNSQNVAMPRYGNDCSGFVSMAYEIPRQNTTQFINGVKNGTYKRIGSYDPNNLTRDALLSSYANMTAGDALVKEGHALFVASNMSGESYCIMYEQTPYYAQTTRWTYAELANGGYMPFSK